MIAWTLLVTASAERRRAWTAQLRDDRVRIRHCDGPTATRCPLLNGERTCPLYADADAVVYDQDVMTHDLLVALLLSPPTVPIHFAIANGLGRPHVTYALAGGMVRRVGSGAPP